MEAVKQGSATVGVKNKTHAILVALKRASSELSAHQKKIIPIDDHVGITIAGLTADARMLSRFMRTECLNNRYSHKASLPINRIVAVLGNKMQVCTQRYDRRPYGVGLLVAGYDDMGPHIYQTCPSANYFDCKAMAIGARSQSARTYLEKRINEFQSCSLEDLIKHGLLALRDTLPNEVELTTKNCSVAVVGRNTNFVIYDDEAVAPYLASIEGVLRTHGPQADEAKADVGMDAGRLPTEPEPEPDVAGEDRMQLD
uniref:Proteasome subunit alpha type-1 n=1 Tax=Strigamia maritima TaxID=126957 RepID=T1JG89_STRMM